VSIAFLISSLGIALLVAGLVLRRSQRPYQDRLIRTGGFTVDQIRIIRRAIIRGRFPDPPELHGITVAYARQGVQNLRLGFRSAPLIWAGLILLMSLFYAVPNQAAVGIGFQIAFLALAIYMMSTNVRALRGCRTVVAIASAREVREPEAE
jgi:hypothetical protein